MIRTFRPSGDMFALSYRSSPKGFTGVYALPGDETWRQCRDAAGRLLWQPTVAEAEANAAYRLVADLNAEPRP